MADKKDPLVSVITVSYNAVFTIEETILSVINQTYPNIEYIIIDGGSTDGTVEVIKKYADKISYWVSEPDKGIYDAMNKRVRQSKGEWVNFMNSGDSFYDVNTLYNIFVLKSISSNISVIYGKTCKITKYATRIETPLSLNNMNKRLPFCHQSSFIKLDLLLAHPYNLNYKIVADDDFFYSMYKLNVDFMYVDIPIAIYEAFSGVSSKNVKTALWENYLIRGGKSYLFFIFSIYLPIIFRYKIRFFMDLVYKKIIRIR